MDTLTGIYFNNDVLSVILSFFCLTEINYLNNNWKDIYDPMEFAAAFGFFDLLEWGVKNNKYYDDFTFKYAFYNNDFKVLEWAHENLEGYKRPYRFSEDVIYEYGQFDFEFVKWLHKNKYNLSDQEMYENAINNEDLEWVKWAHENKYKITKSIYNYGQFDDPTTKDNKEYQKIGEFLLEKLIN